MACVDAFVHLFLFESRALCVNLRVDGTVHRQYVHPICTFRRCVQGKYHTLVMQVLSRRDVRFRFITCSKSGDDVVSLHVEVICCTMVVCGFKRVSPLCKYQIVLTIVRTYMHELVRDARF